MRFSNNRQGSDSHIWKNINSIYIAPERTVEAVGYYAIKKRQLQDKNKGEKGENFKQIHTLKEREFQKSVQKIEQSLQNNEEIDPHDAFLIKQVSLEPVFQMNTFSQLTQADYPLEEAEKVKVCEEKLFSTKNYYNYLYEIQYKKEILKFMEKSKNKIEEQIALGNSKNHDFTRKRLNSEDQIRVEEQLRQNQIFQQIRQKENEVLSANHEAQLKVMRSMHKTKFTAFGGIGPRGQQAVKVEKLNPVHVQYNESNHKTFEKKEKDKKEKQRARNIRRSNWNQ